MSIRGMFVFLILVMVIESNMGSSEHYASTLTIRSSRRENAAE